MTDNLSEKDKKDWETFISSKEKISNKDDGSKKEKHPKTRSVDLHGYTLDQANKFIYDFIINSYKNEIKKIIVVTGKGLHSDNEKNPYVSKDLSILKYSVPEYILNNKNLMTKINEIKEANIEDGGSGAFYIFLKKNSKV